MAAVQSASDCKSNVIASGEVADDYSCIPEKVGFIGAGNMAQAMIVGFISKGIVKGSQIFVSAPSTRNTAKLSHLNVEATTDNQKVVDNCDIVFFAVKPLLMREVIKQLNLFEVKKQLFISIAAGFSISSLEDCFMRWPCKLESPRVIRVMPNTPCMVQEGCCAYSMGRYTKPEDGAVAKKMLSVLGICEEVPESQIDAVGGLAGSGPAYIYAAIEAMADGGVKMGLPRSIAMKFAAKTVRGAATMVLETGRHPGQLKDEVCSPSGTTIAAMHSLEKNAFRSSLISAVEASTLRSRELNA